MRKIAYKLLIITACLSLTACANSKAEQPEETKNIMLENPTYTAQEQTDIADDRFEKIDNYLVYKFKTDREYYAAAPDYNSNNNLLFDLKSVIKANFDRSFNWWNYYGKLNVPAGMKYDIESSGLNFSRLAYPDFVTEYNGTEAEKFELFYIKPVWNEMIISVDNEEAHKEIMKYDCECISMALYEDFYENIPKLKLSVYGVTEEIYNTYLEDREYVGRDGNKYTEKFFNPQKMYEEYRNGTCQIDLLIDEDIAKSGNYYIDYSNLSNKQAYRQVVYVLSFDKEPENGDYSFAINSFRYNLEDDALYNSWKKENEEAFIKWE